MPISIPPFFPVFNPQCFECVYHLIYGTYRKKILNKSYTSTYNEHIHSHQNSFMLKTHENHIFRVSSKSLEDAATFFVTTKSIQN